MAFNSKYNGEQVEEILDKVYTFNLENVTAEPVANIPYLLGANGSNLVKCENPLINGSGSEESDDSYLCFKVATSSSANVSFRYGMQYANGTNAPATITMNGTPSYLTALTNVNSNSLTIHRFNAVFDETEVENLVFRPTFSGQNITRASLWGNMVAVNMTSTFNGCYNLTSLNMASFTGENVTNMASTFNGCNRLTSLNMASFTGENVTSMAYAFYNCYNLTSLNMASFTGENVTNMAYAFNGCYNLTTHGINSWTGANANCYNMFRMCNKLDDIQIHWNITCASGMFANRNTPLNVYASTVTNAYNAIYVAMGNSTTNSNWNVTLYELNE